MQKPILLVGCSVESGLLPRALRPWTRDLTSRPPQGKHTFYVGLRVESRHHLQSVCLQDVVSVDQIDENSLGLFWLVSATASTLQPRLSPKRFSSNDDDEMMTMFNKK
ncbi:hypothetical protein AVEN_126848-1 [Araneus ventricosus]|uniref:Uncharacterized protein n=1 Tax=Araneus ventricosus TaxID=182803 RepID=A0A4Y2HJP0_ARAVE|nr:hypothetical protein AVEN_126848-1 [Araneus ventricosus]